jgi:hypothetical protein
MRISSTVTAAGQRRILTVFPESGRFLTKIPVYLKNLPGMMDRGQAVSALCNMQS